MNSEIPKDFTAFQIYWQEQGLKIKENYLNDNNSWLVGLFPSIAIQQSAKEVCELLNHKLRADFEEAINPDVDFPSPLSEEEDAQWLKTTNMVGINVRTIGNFFNIIKYALTLPDHVDSIHLLPIWEPGVVSSLYGIASRNINTEFFSEELYQEFKHLDTAERQLKAVINLLHALGKSVGMDVIPHTDRYSEIVLANPAFFEWLQRSEKTIVRHEADLHLTIQEEIFAWLKLIGTANSDYSLPSTAGAFFSTMISETKRLEILFGTKEDVLQRNERRGKLVDYLFRKGFEPVPATMAPPYRGIQVNEDENAVTIDEFGREWRDYKMQNPKTMSRVFGPLTRFKFYERKNDNKNWEIDFNVPRVEVWEYFKDFYAEQAEKFCFDFMRGDMSHVQMRPEGVPMQVEEYYDPHKDVRNYIAEEKPWFGYFAETFLTHADYMAFGDEVDHLEMSDADSTLGNLQSMVPGSDEFLQAFRLYLDVLQTRYFAPNFTIMTADKDDPRFDAFYEKGNEARLFTGLFLTDMPSYYGLGFECRDQHLTPAPNEHYTKLYVFQIAEGPKSTQGDYQWGTNAALFANLTQIHLFYEKIKEEIEGQQTQWLLPPDSTGKRKYVAWTQAEKPTHVFLVNWEMSQMVKNVKIPAIWDYEGELNLVFSTINNKSDRERLEFNSYNYPIAYLQPGECLVFALE